MTMPPGDAPTVARSRAELLELLEADAEYFQPRLFAIYGIREEIDGFRPGREFLGWGIEFHHDEGAIFCDPNDGSIHCSDSAERLLATCQRSGEAHLVWLED
jgi:hypothetical protein